MLQTYRITFTIGLIHIQYDGSYMKLLLTLPELQIAQHDCSLMVQGFFGPKEGGPLAHDPNDTGPLAQGRNETSSLALGHNEAALLAGGFGCCV